MSRPDVEKLPELWDAQHAKDAAAKTATMPINRAAWQKEKGAPFVVEEAPLPEPHYGQVLIKVGAVALNPADWILRDTGILITKWPMVGGCDVAGTVVSVGKGLKQFKKGDRVFGMTAFLQHGDGHAAFQEYMILDWPVIGKTPDEVSDAAAATINAGAATSADGLFRGLALQWPQAKTASRTNETVIIWGGSSSVGATGIQMLVAAGYDVVATASPHNFAFCKGLGASQVIDYNSKFVVEELIAASKDKKVAGAMGAISTEQSIQALCRVVAAVPGARKLVISVYPGADSFAVEGVEVSFAECLTMGYSELGAYLWERFLPEALANGKFKAKPEPKIVGRGLQSINLAADILKAGVSATKIVVTL